MDRKSKLKEAWDKYFPELYFMVKKMVQDNDVVDEVLSNSFILLWRKLEKDISGDKNIESFLYTTSRELSILYLKRQQNETTISL